MKQEEISCAVCDVLKKTCKDLGDENFCSNLIEDLKKNKISEEELTDKVIQKFGPEKFTCSWNENVENEN